MANEFNRINNFSFSFLSSGITNSQTEIKLDDISSFPLPPFIFKIDNEIIRATGKNISNNFLCVRGKENTTPTNHNVDSFASIVFTEDLIHQICDKSRDNTDFYGGTSQVFYSVVPENTLNRKNKGNSFFIHDNIRWQTEYDIEPDNKVSSFDIEKIADVFIKNIGEYKDTLAIESFDRSTSGTLLNVTEIIDGKEVYISSNSDKHTYVGSAQRRNDTISFNFFASKGANNLVNVDMKSLDTIGIIPTGSEITASTINISGINSSYDGHEITLYNDTLDKTYKLMSMASSVGKNIKASNASNCAEIEPYGSIKMIYDAGEKVWRPLVNMELGSLVSIPYYKLCCLDGVFKTPLPNGVTCGAGICCVTFYKNDNDYLASPKIYQDLCGSSCGITNDCRYSLAGNFMIRSSDLASYKEGGTVFIYSDYCTKALMTLIPGVYSIFVEETVNGFFSYVARGIMYVFADQTATIWNLREDLESLCRGIYCNPTPTTTFPPRTTFPPITTTTTTTTTTLAPTTTTADPLAPTTTTAAPTTTTAAPITTTTSSPAQYYYCRSGMECQPPSCSGPFPAPFEGFSPCNFSSYTSLSACQSACSLTTSSPTTAAPPSTTSSPTTTTTSTTINPTAPEMWTCVGSGAYCEGPKRCILAGSPWGALSPSCPSSGTFPSQLACEAACLTSCAVTNKCYSVFQCQPGYGGWVRIDTRCTGGCVCEKEGPINFVCSWTENNGLTLNVPCI